MYVRLKVLKDKKPKEYTLSKKYFNFLKSRTKEKTFEERKKLKFSSKLICIHALSEIVHTKIFMVTISWRISMIMPY